MSGNKTWPGYTDKAFPKDFNTVPSPLQLGKPGQLTKDQVHQFFNEGFVVVENLLESSVLEEVKNDINGLVDDLAKKLFNAGKITSVYSEYGFFERLTMMEKEFPGTNIILHKLGQLTEGMKKLWSHKKLLNINEQLLGTPDIVGHPVWNLRTKTPQNEATIVPWHQDNAYFDDNCYEHLVLTAWIPFLDATEENGCMQMVKGGQKTGRVATHQCCAEHTWYVMVDEEEMTKTLGIDMKRDLKTCPVPYGGAVIFSNAIPHRSLPNVSKSIRWSMDLRWQREADPIGFFDLKDGIKMRSSIDPNLRPDWKTFDAVDRQAVTAEELGIAYDVQLYLNYLSPL